MTLGAFAQPAAFEQGPTPENLAPYYPESARASHVTGVVVVECLGTPQGRLQDCAVKSERPKGHGFGEATIKAAEEKFRLQRRSGSIDGYGGLKIYVTVRWEDG